MSEHVKRGDFILELETRQAYFKEVLQQIIVTGEKHLGGADFSLGWNYIGEPFLMVDNEHTHTFDQVLFFLGDQADVKNFGGVVELQVGNDHQQYIIDYTSCVYIPAGIPHGPLEITQVSKPFMFLDITLSPGIYKASE